LDLQVLEGGYCFSADENYVVPEDSKDISSYVTFIQGLPERETPAVFAMHANADISFQVADCKRLDRKGCIGCPQRTKAARGAGTHFLKIPVFWFS
jgi:hypothetical protein